MGRKVLLVLWNAFQGRARLLHFFVEFNKQKFIDGHESSGALIIRLPANQFRANQSRPRLGEGRARQPICGGKAAEYNLGQIWQKLKSFSPYKSLPRAAMKPALLAIPSSRKLTPWTN